jgi:Domain of unknown function (DUF1877)
MSVIGALQHISVNGLRRIKENPEVFWRVISDLSPANIDTQFILDTSELTFSQISILGEIMPDINVICNRWTQNNVEEVEFLKELNPELYEHLKLDLYSIVIDEKDCCYLDFNKEWTYVSSLFQAGRMMDPSVFISTIDNRHNINIFSGKPVDPDDSRYFTFRYQEIDEVREIAKALSTIDESDIRLRFEQILQTDPRPFPYRWADELHPLLLQHCQDVRIFYETAAEKKFGVVSTIG